MTSSTTLAPAAAAPASSKGKPAPLSFFSEDDKAIVALGNTDTFAPADTISLPRKGKALEFFLAIARTGKEGLSLDDAILEVYGPVGSKARKRNGEERNLETLRKTLRVYPGWNIRSFGVRLGYRKADDKYVAILRKGQTAAMIRKAIGA